MRKKMIAQSPKRSALSTHVTPCVVRGLGRVCFAGGCRRWRCFRAQFLTTTTALVGCAAIWGSCFRSRRLRRFSRNFALMLVRVVDRVLNLLQFFRLGIRNLHLEFVLKLHDEFDIVEGVGVEVFVELGLQRHLRFRHVELFSDDVPYHILDLFL
jgi:hypothetical protein